MRDTRSTSSSVAIVGPAVGERMPAKLRDLRNRVPWLPLLRQDVASNGPA
jgi:hypothetical protein